MKKYVMILVVLFTFHFSIADNTINFSEIKDWSPQDSTLSYNASNLWEYINGAADLFLGFGFEQLQSQDICRGDFCATVDIYDMGEPLNAYGVYMTERSDAASPLSIGAEAVVNPPYQCLMLKDRFYIKVNIYEGRLSGKIGSDLLNDIAAIIPGEERTPKELDLLPDDNMTPESFGYIHKGYQGLSELNRCVFAEYQDSLSAYQAFIIPVNTDRVWETLKGKWKTSQQTNLVILYRKIPYKGYIGALKKGDNIIGVCGLSTKDELIKRIVEIGGNH